MPSCPLFGTNLDVMDFLFIDSVVMDSTFFTNMIPSDRVTFMYISFMSGGITSHVTIADGNALLVVFHLINPRFIPNMFSVTIMPSLVTGNYGSWLTLTILS